MEFSLLTYNTLFNKATIFLKKIVDLYFPDIICLQEFKIDDANFKRVQNLNYSLADYSNCLIKRGEIYGTATFYNASKFYLEESQIFPTIQSLFTQLLSLFKITSAKNLKPNFLKTVLIPKDTKKKVIIYNCHLPVLGLNNIKIKQLEQLLNKLDNRKNATIIAGDFNYFPYGRKKLEKLMNKFSFQEATKNISYTISYSRNLKKLHYNFIARLIIKSFRKFFTDRLKIDYIYYKNLYLIESKRVDINYSDHYPIISTFKI